MLSRFLMRQIVKLAASMVWVAFVLLAGYEITQKTAASALGPVPGHEVAQRAERGIRYSAVTGIMPVDHILHESQEACKYYRDLVN